MDIPQPLKAHLPAYYDIENKFQQAIYSRFNVENSDENIIKLKEVDSDLAIYEARELMPSKARDGRWNPPTVEQPCDKVLDRIKNTPSAQESVEEFWYLCDVLEIK